MAALFHFIFELAKITVLAAAYGGIIYLLLYLICRAGIITRSRRISFALIYSVVYVMLFVFSFTYYGDHGLGDEAYIPLGHFETMEAGDGNAYFTFKKSRNQLFVDSFAVKNNTLCMMTDSGLCIYDLKTDSLQTFADSFAYKQYARKEKLPPLTEFKNFEKQYAEYWNGWRFWTMP